MQANNDILLPSTVASVTTDNNIPLATPLAPIKIMLDSFIEQKTIFNKNMSESMSQQIVALKKTSQVTRGYESQVK